MTEVKIRSEVGAIERLRCMDEVDLECTHCGGLTAHRLCGGENKTHCVHCGNPLDPKACKHHKPLKRDSYV